MEFKIAPISGWEEHFINYEDAYKRASEIIENDEERISSLRGYKKPEHLIEEVWSDPEYKAVVFGKR